LAAPGVVGVDGGEAEAGVGERRRGCHGGATAGREGIVSRG
jgi:hypothetical protein